MKIRINFTKISSRDSHFILAVVHNRQHLPPTSPRFHCSNLLPLMQGAVKSGDWPNSQCMKGSSQWEFRSWVSADNDLILHKLSGMAPCKKLSPKSIPWRFLSFPTSGWAETKMDFAILRGRSVREAWSTYLAPRELIIRPVKEFRVKSRAWRPKNAEVRRDRCLVDLHTSPKSKNGN